jgi:predicted exporter
MIRTAALLWLLIVAAAGIYLAARIHAGLHFRTDLMALLPRDQRDPALQKATDAVTASLSRQFVLLVGHDNRDRARAAAKATADALEASGLVILNTSGFSGDRLRRIGELYFPFRGGLLSDSDRHRLRDGRAHEIVVRALSQVYGLVGMGDARLLRSDPFLLLPAFLTGLPLPLSRLSLDDGMLTVHDHGLTWILVAGHLRGDPYALAIQDHLARTLDGVIAAQSHAQGLRVLRLGAVFFARAGGERALTETSILGLASVAGTIALVLAVFRALTPLWLNLLAITVGIGTALSACLFIFGEVHVAALLFGVSLIGIAIDYGLQYCSELFAPAISSPRQRLGRVLTGITVGVASVTVGYLTLLLAPFPGLHQIAAFAAIGLLSSWTTVVLWLPSLDRSRPPKHGRRILDAVDRYLTLWSAPRFRQLRAGIFVAAAAISIIGLMRLHADDDVRHMQSLAPDLVAEQEEIQSLIGTGAASQFFLIHAPTDELALEREEVLVDRLGSLVGDGALLGFQAASQYVPSAARQRENRKLVAEHLLGPTLDGYIARLNMSEGLTLPSPDAPTLGLAQALAAGGPLSFLSTLVLNDGGEATHVVILDGVKQRGIVAAAASGIDGVRFVDPAGQFSALLGKYRVRAVILLVAAGALMMPLLIWRYGLRGGVRVMLPTALAVVLAPAIRGLTGGAFTFFDAMALVLVLSVGIDYAVFLAETDSARAPVTMLAVALAAATTLMAFGLLALSSAQAVHSFGATMLIGILLAFLLAPLTTGLRKAGRAP